MMENKYSCFPGNQPDCQASTLALDYVLDARILANDSPANGSDLNGVHYTLSSPTNLPVANQRLEFSVSGNALLVIPSYYTNNSGELDVALSNSVPETVQLNVSLAADPSVNAQSSLTFLPTGQTPTYALTSEVLVDNANADGSSNNVVKFDLTYGGEPVEAWLIVRMTPWPGIPVPPTPVTTGPDGLYIASFSSPDAGSFTVSAELNGDRDVFSAKTITFTEVTYPIYLGSLLVVVPGTFLMGVESLISPFNFIVGHNYRIENIASGYSTIYFCYDYAFEQQYQSCSRSVPSDFIISESGSRIRMLAQSSGQGLGLHASFYYGWNRTTTTQFVVQVYDDGPA